MIKINEAIEKLIVSKKAAGRAERTIKDYRRVLSRFAEAVDPDITTWTRETVREYVAQIRSNGWAPSTCDIHVRYLRAFWRWLHEEGYIIENLAAAVAAPKIRAREEVLLTPDELKRLLAACTGRWGKRDKAIILMLVDTGLRRGELIMLRRDQVNWEDGCAWLLVESPKTDSKHYAILGATASRALRAYLDARDDDYEALWIGIQGPWKYDALYQMLRRRAREAGIPTKKVHPHVFRKIFATWWVNNGGDEVRLQRLGGWKSPAMLKIYVKLAGRAALQRAHTQYSPVDRALEDEDNV